MPPYDFHAANGDPFTYPPFALLTFYPLGWLPDGVVGVAWTAATLLAMVVLASRGEITLGSGVHEVAIAVDAKRLLEAIAATIADVTDPEPG